MNLQTARRALGLATLFGIPLGILGCELALNFDRSLIDGGVIVGGDATFSDAPLPNGDGFVPNADGPLDAPDDTSPLPDAPVGTDGGDGATDAPVDTGSDAGDSADALDVGIDVNGDAADG